MRYVSYSSQDDDTNSPGKMLMDQVNEYIHEVDEDFTGGWLLIVHWDNVHPSPHGEDDHRGIPDSELEKV